jgi:hypothetical protein
VKEDIMIVFMEFHSRRKLEKSINATIFSLIPKKVGTMDVKDLRPISLVGGVYKFLPKVLANMLKLVWKKIIFNSHNAFIGGTQILDWENPRCSAS